MNLSNKILITSFCLLVYSNITAQGTLKSGVILNKTDSTPIKLAHIINTNSNIGVVSNVNGEFTISANKEDTLLISFVGFKSLRIKASTIFKNIYLEKQVHSLESFTVLPYNNFKEFREAFVNLELPDTARNKINPSIFLSREELRMYDGSRGFSGGISSLMGKFNKYVQDKKNYERLLERDKYQAFIATKFSPQLIKRITDLKDNKSIESFMDYCDFTDRFIETSSNYEIIDQIYECYDEYNSLPIASK